MTRKEKLPQLLQHYQHKHKHFFPLFPFHTDNKTTKRGLTPVAHVSSSSSSSKFWMYERCFKFFKSAKTDEHKCLLTKTSSTKHERAVRIGKG